MLSTIYSEFVNSLFKNAKVEHFLRKYRLPKTLKIFSNEYFVEENAKGSVVVSFGRFETTMFLTGVIIFPVRYVNVHKLKYAKRHRFLLRNGTNACHIFQRMNTFLHGYLFREKLPYDLNTKGLNC